MERPEPSHDILTVKSVACERSEAMFAFVRGMERKMAGVLWASDFDFSGGRVKVHKTGADMALDSALLVDVATWLTYYIPARFVGAVRRLANPGPKVWFSPDQPRPWYLIWLAMTWGGLRFARSPAEARASVYFEDATSGAPPVMNGGGRRINFACTDVSKTKVASAFETVFGYALALDPATWSGPAVEKGELNGVHDGRIVQCPMPGSPGKVYQHLVDNADGDMIEDLRTPCVAGRPVLVFRKQRPIHDRFANYNTRVTLDRPERVFSPEDLRQIEAFNQAMQLDWGGLDILRDRQSGKLYIVDVNKTDMPPLRLPWTDKMKATRMLADALLDLVNSDRSGT